MKRVIRLVCAAAVTGIILFKFRSFHLKWGASEGEAVRPLPGDDLLPAADLVATRAISIDRPASDVWPWVAQLGQGRAGFYSYDFLENLVGCDIHSAESIVSQWQSVAAGDEFRLHPDVPLEVAEVVDGESLVVRGGVEMGDAPPPYEFIWSFNVRESAPGACRLIVRERYKYSKWWAPLIVEPVETVSFVMTQKMLRGIRERALGL